MPQWLKRAVVVAIFAGAAVFLVRDPWPVIIGMVVGAIGAAIGPDLFALIKRRGKLR